jgi:hypothetical protein
MSKIMRVAMKETGKRIRTEQHRLEHKGIDSRTAHILAIRKEIARI